MLSGLKILSEYYLGRIIIEDFDKCRLNPNSYNLRLADTLMMYSEAILDCRKENKTNSFTFSEYVLYPGNVYLAHTMEWTETPYHVPLLEGRSSLGRLGLDVHATAGFGDIGFAGRWTLELSVKQPLRIYAGMEICQIAYHSIEGDYVRYQGKYQGSKDVQASRMFTEKATG